MVDLAHLGTHFNGRNESPYSFKNVFAVRAVINKLHRWCLNMGKSGIKTKSCSHGYLVTKGTNPAELSGPIPTFNTQLYDISFHLFSFQLACK